MSINTLLGIGDRESVGSVLARHRGIGPGFDLLRIVLALYIFYGHALWISGGAVSVAGVNGLAAIHEPARQGFFGWKRPFHVAAVPVFFALSGFLVSGSALRLRAMSTFLAFRFFRIFPALVVETALCAIMLGALLTTLPRASYYSDPLFFRYLGNMVGHVSFFLPGLFQSNPVKGVVNANLWTLPAEFYCYLLLAVLMVARIAYSRIWFTTLYAAVAIMFVTLSFTHDFGVTSGILPPAAIVFYFFTGVLLYHWRAELPAHWALFVAAAVIGFALLMVEQAVYLTPLFVTYCTVFVGLVAIPKLPLIGTGDYSYGIYLYGFPITQSLVAVFPAIFIGHGFLLLAVSTVLTCSFAAFSWHVVEKHALAQKRHLPKRWFPTPAKVIRQSPQGRTEMAGEMAGMAVGESAQQR